MRKCVFLFAVTLAVMLNTTNGWGQEVVFSEGFDDSANLPAGWTQSGTSGCYWYVSNRNVEGYPNNPYSGSYSAFSYLNGKNDSIKLITPAIDMSSYETVKLTFAYINMQKESKLPNSIDKITIYYRTSSSDSWHPIGNILISMKYGPYLTNMRLRRLHHQHSKLHSWAIVCLVMVSELIMLK